MNQATMLAKVFRDTLWMALVFTGAIGSLSGCGSSTSNRANSPSSGPPNITPPSGGPVNSSNAGAECNLFDSTQIRLAGKVTTYYYNSTLQEDKVRIRFSGLAEQFDTTSGVHFKMFRWKADTGGAVQIDNNPLSFTVEKGSSSSTPISEPMTSFSATNLANLRQSGEVAGTTTQAFLDNTLFVVNGVDYNWDALKIVLYSGTNTLGQVDFLLPIFTANPNSYASNHPAVLAGIHPFWSQRTTNQDWVARAWSFCF
jgi:hypothetical protein